MVTERVDEVCLLDLRRRMHFMEDAAGGEPAEREALGPLSGARSKMRGATLDSTHRHILGLIA